MGAVAGERIERGALEVLEAPQGLGRVRVSRPGPHLRRRSVQRVDLRYGCHVSLRQPAERLGQLRLPHWAAKPRLRNETMAQPRVVRLEDGVGLEHPGQPRDARD